MLVSSIARFEAMNTMNNAAFASMQASNAMMNNLRNVNTFSGEHSLDMLHEMDNRLSLDLISNALLYKIAYLQEKMFNKMQIKELENSKKSINYFA